MAYNGKYIDKARYGFMDEYIILSLFTISIGLSYRVYCIMGDGESAEGSIWEAAAFAGHYKLDNLVAIFDVNRLGQSEPAALQHEVETYRKRMESFGYVYILQLIITNSWNDMYMKIYRFHAVVVDGHDVEELCRNFHEATTVKGKPTCFIAKTFKGAAPFQFWVQCINLC